MPATISRNQDRFLPQLRLATQPGQVADDYVRGQRQRNFDSIAFQMVAVGFASSVILISNTVDPW